MTLTYWKAGEVQLMLVGPFTKETICAGECCAPFTPITLIIEISY